MANKHQMVLNTKHYVRSRPLLLTAARACR